MLAYQQKESTARVASIMENTNLSKQQQVSEIMRKMLTQAQTAGQYFTNDQIKEMTRKVSAEVDLVHQQTYFFFYDSSPTEIYTLSLHDALPISTSSTSMPPSLDAMTHTRCVPRSVTMPT